jgi:hypothetical protein
MVHEENLLVTRGGAQLISMRTPQEIPVIRD